jgi:PadR family transcriptional regulator, regulatory protein PadR
MEKAEKKSELLPGTLDMLILNSLSRNPKPMHGYGIAQYIKQISDDVLQVEEGSLYPALQGLILKGWVLAQWGQSENNRRARFYKLTPAGRKQLEREVANLARSRGNPARDASGMRGANHGQPSNSTLA